MADVISFVQGRWYLSIPFGIEVVWGAFVLVAHYSTRRTLRERFAKTAGVAVRDVDWESVASSEWFELEHKSALGKLIEGALIFYHFPVVVPMSLLNGKEGVSGWALYTITPLLYAALLLVVIG